MDRSKAFLAFDLGAESGRAVIGRLKSGRIDLEVVHRFPNIPVQIPGGLHWDALRLFHEMKDGLRLAARHAELASAGVDTWGVDFALLDSKGGLLANPHHYRDSRTDGVMDEVFSIVPRAEVFHQTGIQFLPFNTLYQMFALKRDNPKLLESAERIILIPDLFHYWFTGNAVCEFTEATTSQMLNPRTGNWAKELLHNLNIPVHKMGEIIQPGSRLGAVLPRISEECACPHIPVIAPATHDTGSAVAAVPATGSDFAYISSGTWSLVGVEVSEPVINEKSLEYNFTNEGGVTGTHRLLKNVMGLWIVQECRRQWEKEGISYDYTRLTQMAAECQPYATLIDPDAPQFLPPGNMPERIIQFCQKTGQAVPENHGQIIRTALDSLALKYRWVVERLEELTGKPISTIHIVGGGIQNRLLTQLTADACGRSVFAGPVEATAYGNILMQAIGLGEISTLQEGRSIIRASEDLAEYTPDSSRTEAVSDAYGRLLDLMKQ